MTQTSPIQAPPSAVPVVTPAMRVERVLQVRVTAAMSRDAVNFAEMSRAARRNHMKKIRQTINAIIDKFSDDDGWVALGRVGDELAKRLPDFDVRNYGFKKLRPFLKSLGVYEFDEPENGSGQHQIYLRLREQEN